MKVLIVNTSEKTGGAAIAANRLMEALNNNGVYATMLVRDKSTDNLRVAKISDSKLVKWNFLWERWCIYMNLHLSKAHLFEIDIANTGTDITKLSEFAEADIIHLHWINQGMLSLDVIKKIIQSGKPVVWTMHDFWAATGICHYPHECTAYLTKCHNCQYLPGGGSSNDLSNKIWTRKSEIYKGANITFVACSRWLAEKVRESSLLANKTVLNIPNPIDTKLFHPIDKAAARQKLSLPKDKKLILFVSQRITDKRKGMEYLVEACQLMVKQHPEMASNTAVVILGGQADAFAERLPLQSYPLGYVSDNHKIVDIYNAVDTYVLPSLEDNLPNTIMEAMACGVPCVGFNVGGIPEMINHNENGYVAEFKNAQDLSDGIYQVLNASDYHSLSNNAVAKVMRCYSQSSVAKRYYDVYAKLIRR